jgi:hypothetical protein
VPAAFAGTYPSRFQPVHLGSCGVVVPVNPIALTEPCTIVVRVQPWLLDGRPQTVLAIEGGPALFVSAEGARLELGDRRVQLAAPILKGRWHELRVIAGNELGGYGGLWRRNGRAPQLLCGVGFSAQGLFEGSYYRRMPGAADPRAAWILDGVDGEVIGDFGLSGGGAAGFELDRADFALGTPPNALILARSEGHQSHFGTVLEELLSHLATLNGERPKDLIRAEIVYFETTAGGTVGIVNLAGLAAVAPTDRDG